VLSFIAILAGYFLKWKKLLSDPIKLLENCTPGLGKLQGLWTGCEKPFFPDMGVGQGLDGGGGYLPATNGSEEDWPFVAG